MTQRTFLPSFMFEMGNPECKYTCEHCPRSTHHVNSTLVLIRLSLTEWASSWRVHPTTTPAFLDTPPSLVHPSTTAKRSSVHSKSCHCR
ncbi:predicted protein [Lichtheimia corymbifera JMRC:FSU:9682]|uniref:Uncharacterized protein n=1 Tax=Lichtheimia corymbifera JMRC:FSU:9682 TaxID=1263082 RepID=A0A068RF33_9FUNG|nr:predicted protein [Lichtheimia corymbifera JMRC:FSU:9682]